MFLRGNIILLSKLIINKDTWIVIGYTFKRPMDRASVIMRLGLIASSMLKGDLQEFI
jgi:hypothetical protein